MKTDKIKLDIISDVVCPWCTIGYKRLERAIEEMGVSDKLDIEWQPFELNPHMPAEGENVQEHIANKYNASPEDQQRSQEHMKQAGSELGFTFDYFDQMRMVNTRDAHVLLDFAKEKGKQTELKMRLVTAFFSERKDVSDREILMQEVKAIGLNPTEALAKLDNDDARYEVQAKESYWQNLGVSSVPTMVFNGKSAVTGAQTVDVYKQILTELLDK
ncbi:DsbA family oxidoreductase [Aquimarina intermedia]|uniref:Putative DsbA family dithiol-disulfide isomerase n=1 Tax=Aquimarina intermedia TaxID=350814 RepID=A0A5S5CFB7_9FLAO|nr:DsbA family oxidoreductase [Aquimarina intermedia]TYP77212.1 putative DsbA family dithiol-disulfide isomerase [Aquimarina intermedia]